MHQLPVSDGGIRIAIRIVLMSRQIFLCTLLVLFSGGIKAQDTLFRIDVQEDFFHDTLSFDFNGLKFVDNVVLTSNDNGLSTVFYMVCDNETEEFSIRSKDKRLKTHAAVMRMSGSVFQFDIYFNRKKYAFEIEPKKGWYVNVDRRGEDLRARQTTYEWMYM